jgi:hypothetical protein
LNLRELLIQRIFGEQALVAALSEQRTADPLRRSGLQYEQVESR